MRMAPELFGMAMNRLYSDIASLSSDVERGSNTIAFRARRRCQGDDWSAAVDLNWAGTIGNTNFAEACFFLAAAAKNAAPLPPPPMDLRPPYRCSDDDVGPPHLWIAASMAT